MSAIEQSARELLAEALRRSYPDDIARRMVINQLLADELDLINARVAVAVLVAALTPPEGYVLVPVDSERDAGRYRHLKRGYVQCWEDSRTEEPSHANFCFECKGWDIDSAIDADIALSKLEASP